MPTTTRTVIVLQLAPGWRDEYGNTYPAAVALPSAENEDIIDEQGGIPWLIWGSAAALAGGYKPVGQHNTQVNKAAFEAGASLTIQQVTQALGVVVDPAAETEAQNTAYLCILEAMSVTDTPDANTDGTPKTNTDGSPVLRAWFAGATPVPLQLTVTA